MNIAEMHAEWKTDVVVLRGGGLDGRGRPLPVERIPVDECLIAPRSTQEPADRSELVESTAVLYRGRGFAFLSTDHLEVPEGSLMAGKWAVDGRPGEWPAGWEVPLRRK